MRPRGGVIGANVTPTQTAASGVWTVREVEAYTRANAWPALPGAPTSVSGTAGNAQVSLTWTAPSSTGGYAITDYTVQYSSNSGSSWTTFSRAASSATSATVTGLTNGTAYTFRVAAVTVLGSGAYSTASSSVTPSAPAFSPTAVLLTSGTTYTVPSGATTMKAWAVGGASYHVNTYARTSNDSTAGGAGGCAYKTWSVSGGQSISYSVGAGGATSGGFQSGGNTTVTFGGTTITGNGGNSSGAAGFSGGDGGASGGLDRDGDSSNSYSRWGGAVGGNSGTAVSGQRRRATNVSGLFEAVALAGGKTVEDDGAIPAFGSGSWVSKFSSGLSAGRGGGGRAAQGGGGTQGAGGGAVVLYFT